MQADEQARPVEHYRAVEKYLHEHIPMSAAMGVRVKRATLQRVHLAAPLAPNANHHETVFGGSAVAVATLAAWTLVHLRLDRAGADAQLVIQRSTMEYKKPMAGDFEAICEFDDRVAWQRFKTTLDRRGRARLTVKALLLRGEHEAGAFEGDFVALRSV